MREWPASGPCRDNVAMLLARLAAIEHAPVLLAIVVDPREDAHVRVRAFAGLARLGVAPGGRELARLLSEVAPSCVSPAGAHRGSIACDAAPLAALISAVDALAIAAMPDALPLATAQLANCRPEHRTAVLLAALGRPVPRGPVVERLYCSWLAEHNTALHAGLPGKAAWCSIDDEIAWASRDDPRSQELLHRAMVTAPLDLRRLLRAAACPGFLARTECDPVWQRRALVSFALPARRMLERLGESARDWITRALQAYRDALTEPFANPRREPEHAGPSWRSYRLSALHDRALRALAMVRELPGGGALALDLLSRLPDDELSRLPDDELGSGHADLVEALVEAAWAAEPAAPRQLARSGAMLVRLSVVERISRAPNEGDLAALWDAVAPGSPLPLVRAGLRGLLALGASGPRFEAVLVRLAFAADPFVPLYVAMARAGRDPTAVARIRAEAQRRDTEWGSELSRPRIEALQWLARRGDPADLALLARIARDHAGCPCGACRAYPVAAIRAVASHATADAYDELLRACLRTADPAVLDAGADALAAVASPLN